MRQARCTATVRPGDEARWLTQLISFYNQAGRTTEGSRMLILTRRVGETVMVGDDIAVKVVGVKGNQVRLGIEAPRETAVHREEVHERIHAQAHTTERQER